MYINNQQSYEHYLSGLCNIKISRKKIHKSERMDTRSRKTKTIQWCIKHFLEQFLKLQSLQIFSSLRDSLSFNKLRVIACFVYPYQLTRSISLENLSEIPTYIFWNKYLPSQMHAKPTPARPVTSHSLLYGLDSGLTLRPPFDTISHSGKNKKSGSQTVQEGLPR